MTMQPSAPYTLVDLLRCLIGKEYGGLRGRVDGRSAHVEGSGTAPTTPSYRRPLG
jgi:hypothetical protein